MAAQNFRSAFNGFNREDVVHYIEYLNAKHTGELNQLQAEADYLRGQASQAAENPALAEQIAALEAERDALRAENDVLKQELAAAKEAKTLAEASREEALGKAAKCQVEQELEAYRRAERTERVARERAEQVYHQVNGVLADATVKVDEASGQLGDVTGKVSAQLSLLQQAVENSRKALADAAATLYAIRPGMEEN